MTRAARGWGAVPIPKVAPGVAVRLQRLAEDLHDVLADVVGMGQPIAECYLDGALMSLRIAAGVLLRACPQPDAERPDGSFRVLLATGAPTGATAALAADGVWEVSMPGVPRPARPAGPPDLGAALLGNPEALRLAASDVGAAFLRDTLVGRRWTRPGSPDAWWVGATAAGSIVGALRGCLAPSLSSTIAGRAPEREALALVSRLGWLHDVDLAAPHAVP